MVSPINYVLGGQSPVQQLFEGVGFGVGLRQQEQALQQGQQQMGIAAAQEARAAELQPLQVQSAQLGIEGQRSDLERQRQVIEAQDRELARQEAFQMSMGRLAELGADATLQDFQRVGAAFPEFGDAVRETWDTLDENRRTGVKTRLLQIGAAIKGGQTETAIQLGEEYAEAAENSGDAAAAATARGMVEAIKASPQAGLAAIGMTLGAVDPDSIGNLFSTSKVQSSQIIEGRVAVQQMSDGTVRVIDTATGQPLTGQAAQDAIRAAEAAGIEAQAGRAGAREAATLGERAAGAESAKAAESLGAKRGEIVQEASKSVSNVTSTLRNFDRAIRAIDEGANTGVFYNMLPNLTQQSAELKSALDGLGLDVIGSVTFGALSEGELNLAMNVAAPRDLGPEALRDWLVERREAQRKLRESLLEMQSFLADPNNTLKDWYDQVREADAELSGGGDAMDAQGEDRAFIVEMQAKIQRGEELTPDEVSRIEALAGGGQ